MRAVSCSRPIADPWLVAWFDFFTGYLASMAVGLLAARRRGHRGLLLQVLLMPFYWLLISVAAYGRCGNS